MAGAGLASCSQPIPSYTVMGNIPDSTFNGKTVYIFDRDKGQNIDSAVIENGAFTFTGQIDTAVLCLTQVGRKYYTTFMLENGTIQLNMETPNSASGTPLNETFSSYIQEEKRISELFQNKMKEIREQEQDKSKVQELTKTYYDNEYKPAYMAMLKVLGVATWDQPKDTKKAIEDLKITWPQILNAQNTPSELYGFNGIPHIILFGPDGTIVARDLRGDALKAKVKEMMQ